MEIDPEIGDETSQDSFAIDLLNYEATLEQMKKSYCSNLQFYTRDEVETLVKLLPDCYDEIPETANLAEDFEINMARDVATRKTSAKLSGAAEILLYSNVKKANAIEAFVLDKFSRKMVPIMDLQSNNCLFEGTLHQISNREFIINQNGKLFDADDFRMCSLHYAAVNHESVYKNIKHYINCSYKQWIMDNLDKDKETDYGMAVVVRMLIDVSTFFHTRCILGAITALLS